MPGTELWVVLLGLLSAFSWGAGDFSGGLASRRISAYTVVTLSQFFSLLMLLLAAFLLVREPFFPQAGILGAAAGVCSAAGLVALYTGLARGPMGLVAPLTAVVAAVVPVIFGILDSGLPEATDLAGIVLALGGVWAVSSERSQAKIRLPDLGLPLFAGLGFGLFFILMARSSEQAVVWPLIFARSASVLVIPLVGALLRKLDRPRRDQLLIICLVAIFDTGGTLLYILATHFGRLDIAVVLSSLYPAATVLLAWIFLKERLTRRQWTGAGMVLLAVILIAI